MTENSRRTFLTATMAAGGATLAGVPAVGAAEGSTGDPGKPPLAQPPDRELRAIMRAVDHRRIEAIGRKLVSFGTRHTLSAQDDPNRGIGAALDWMYAELQRYAAASEGRMTVDLQSYIQE